MGRKTLLNADTRPRGAVLIRTFDDFGRWAYVRVDEVWLQITPDCHRPGPV
ncbi:MAG: hypothetical protein WKF63_07075 [Thermomicrobiales bacterium]